MTILFNDPLFQQHDTGPHHPERPARLEAIERQLKSSGRWEQCTAGTATAAAREVLLALHDPLVIERVERKCGGGGGHLDADTVVSAQSDAAARLAVGCALAAVDAVLDGKDSNAFCAVRPPGHHATPSRSMGFCLYNNVALAAWRALTHHQLQRILIVDFDVHHGNGTQDIFYEDPRVFFFSAHRYPFYPGTGGESETGRGPGLGTTRNLPVRFGTPPEEYRQRFASCLEECVRRQTPQLVLLSAGFDAHHLDPIGGLGLEESDFMALTAMILEVAQRCCDGRLVSLLEGGYHVDALARCVDDHVGQLLAASRDANRSSSDG